MLREEPAVSRNIRGHADGSSHERHCDRAREVSLTDAAPMATLPLQLCPQNPLSLGDILTVDALPRLTTRREFSPPPSGFVAFLDTSDAPGRTERLACEAGRSRGIMRNARARAAKQARRAGGGGDAVFGGERTSVANARCPGMQSSHPGASMQAIECVYRGWRDYAMTFPPGHVAAELLVDPLRR